MQKGIATIGDVERIVRTAMQSVRQAHEQYPPRTSAESIAEGYRFLDIRTCRFRFSAHEVEAATPFLS